MTGMGDMVLMCALIVQPENRTRSMFIDVNYRCFGYKENETRSDSGMKITSFVNYILGWLDIHRSIGRPGQ